MRIVVGNFNFIRPAGTETYVLSVVPRLIQLGHEVTVFSMAVGPLVDEARRRGVTVTGTRSELPEDCDVVFAQDGPTAYALAERYPERPQVFVCHSPVFDIAHPPRLPNLVRAIVTLNGRTEEHMRAFALDAEIVRLRQPVDTDRFSPRTALADPPRRALVLGNYLQGLRRDVLMDALRSVGLEVVEVGRHAGRFRTDTEAAMNEVDVVCGRGRVMVEAMACGRAAYLYDIGGTDGWVTAETYPELERNNFSGQALDTVPERERVRADLDSYDPLMGTVNRDLAFRHHDHTKHVEALLAVLQRHAGHGAAGGGSLGEMAWLARQNWMLESRAYDLGLEVARVHAEAERAREEAAGLQRELDAQRVGFEERLDDAEARYADASATLGGWQARAVRAEAVAAEQEAFKQTRRYRLAALLARPLDRLRRRGA